jgi:PAS domain S-box-containing protein
MLSVWLPANIDFLFFLHGVIMLLLAAVLYTPCEKKKLFSQEFYLQFFALGMCVNKWIDIVLYHFPSMKILFIPGIIIFSVSFLALLMYGMMFFSGRLKKIAAVYVSVVVVLAIGSFVNTEYNSGYFSLHQILAFPAAFAAAYVFFRYALQSEGYKKNGWLIASVLMFIYSLTWIASHPSVFSDLDSTVNASVYFHIYYPAALQVIISAGILSGFYKIKAETPDAKRFYLKSSFFLLMIIIAGMITWSVASWRGELAGVEIKNEILRNARAVANAIMPERVAGLKFSPEDKNNPDFILIRNQMISYGSYSGLKSIYSFTMINGRLVFGPENIKENDPMASPPGTVYIEPHLDFIKVFEDALPGVIGPYTDEYGTFVAGYAPVIDPRSGNVLMAVGTDLSAEDWRAAVSVARFAVFVISFLVICTVTVMGITIVMRKKRWSNSKSFALRQLETLFIFGTGIFISLVVYLIFNDYENRKAKSDFIPLSDSVAGVIRENIINVNYDLENLGRFFKSSEKIDRNEFRAYTSEMRFSPVKTRGWYAGVKTGGDLTYPLLYIETIIEGTHKPGYDLRSTREGRNAIENSLATGMASFVSYEEFRDVKKNGKLMSVIFPVFKNKNWTEGFLFLTADMRMILSYAMSFSKSRNLNLDAEIIDITTLNHEESLAVYPEGNSYNVKEKNFMQAVYPVFIFDRVLGIKIFSKGGYTKTHLSNTGLMGGVSALMLTIAVTLLSGYLRRREYSLEDMVSERTKELSESEDRFRTLHEASSGGIAIHDNGVIIVCNEGLARLTGYTYPELVGMNGLLLLDPAWRDFVLEKIKTGYEQPYDAVALRKDGTIFPVEITGKIIPYHGKEVRITEFRDITERKQNEEILRQQREELEATNEELQATMEEFEAMNSELVDSNHQLLESEEKFSRAFSINPAVMSISTIDTGEFIEVNDSFLNLFGYQKEDVIGKTVKELGFYYDPEQRDLIIDYIKNDGFVRNLEVAVKGAGNEIRQGLLSADCIRMHDEKYLITVVTDITERKKMEETVRFSEKKYRLLFESAVDAIFLIENYSFNDCNTKAEELFRCTRDDIIGKTPAVFSPEFQPDGSVSLEKAMEKMRLAYQGTPQFFEWTHTTFAGEPIDAEVSLTSFMVEDRNFMIAIVRDISERKRIELRLSHLQKMDAIGQLAGGVAHDFNNQLSGILGYAEILSKKLGDSALKKYSDGIISVAMRSADLTKKLLAFARKGQFQLVQVNLHPLIDETIEMLKHSIDRRINIIRKFNSLNPVVTGDPAQMQNALLNLGLNARDAMANGGTLTYETEDIYVEADMQKVQMMDISAGRYVLVSVSDTGIGMSDAVKSHLFEPFFTTKDSGKGTGMGLASVYGTVKNHNGSISVYSEEGIGTTFKIYLPVSGDSNADSEKQQIEQKPDIPAQRILIIDDETVVRNVLSEMLIDTGHSVIEAVNGAAGLSVYREKWREIDIVIIDMIMPEMSGRDAFLEMKKINPDIRAILSSGFSLDGASQSMMAEGVRGFVHKPYRQNELLRTISEILK